MDKGTVLFTVFALLVLGIGGALAAHYWSDLQGTGANADNLSTTIRNVMLMIGAFLALPLAIWRGWVAERQVKATNESVSAAHEAIANQRFQAAAQMLDNEVNGVRLGAIDTLVALANEDPDRYYVQSTQLLASFIRNPFSADYNAIARISRGEGELIREDVNAALEFVGSRTADDLILEQRKGYRINLDGADLNQLDLRELNLARVSLQSARFVSSHLGGTNLADADLSSALLNGSFLRGTIFRNTKLSGTNFSAWRLDGQGEYDIGNRRSSYEPVAGLVQNQLDEALDDQDDPPKLRGVRDADTDQLLSWHGIPPENL